jgi:dipeptidyl-peptidase-4
MRRALALLAVAVLAAVPRAVAEEQPPVLTVERIFGGKSITTPIPEWAWRPGHPGQLVLTAERNQRRSLVAMDAVSGTETVLLDLPSLEKEVEEGAGTTPRGIGRAGAAELAWSADGRALCALVKGDLVWVDLAGGARRRLTRTRAPLSDVRIAPDGRHVSFSRESDLWVVPTAGGEERQLTTGGSDDVLNATLDWVYPEELGHDTACWWSPDASRLAYLQLDETGVTRFPVPGTLARLGEPRHVRYPKAGDRNPVARVGVVPLAGGPTRWLDLGTPAPEYVVRVAWFPDGRRVAVVTLDREQRRLRLLACDATTGVATVLREETDDAWVDAPPAPRFVDDRTLLWESHRDGATRAWLLRLGEGEGDVAERALTPPDVDLDRVLDFDATRSAVLFTGVRHGESRSSVLVSAPSEDGVRTVPAPFLRDGDGAARAEVDGAAGLAIVRVSGPTTPPRAEVRRVADGTVVRVLGDGRSPDLERVRMPALEYGTLPAEGGVLRWRLWKPAVLEAGRRYPVVVQVYGGPGSRIVRDDWGGGPFLEALLVERGFLVFELDGRGTGGQGAAFQRAVKGRLGKHELEDQVRGVEMLRQRPYVDGARVGIWGWSYGGTMACNALCTRSDVFRVGVAVASVTDWRLYDTIYTERYMGLPSENAKGYAETSCLRSAGKMDGRLLIAHGAEDDNVHVQNSFRLVEALVAAGRTNFDAMIYPATGHALGGKHVDFYGRLVRFFETWLR